MSKKYISVYEPVTVGEKNRGEEQYCLVCGDDGIRKAKGIGSFITAESFPLEDIIRVDCYTGDELENNMASGAAAGLILGGVAGAVVGGLLNSGSSKAWWIEIELKDKSMHYFRLAQGSDNKVFLKWAKKYNVKVEPAKPTENPAENISGADEIIKYKQLLDQGVLTQEEFDAKKKQLLGI